eukprot:3777230-Amphidinium_carterae.1
MFWFGNQLQVIACRPQGRRVQSSSRPEDKVLGRDWGGHRTHRVRRPSAVVLQFHLTPCVANPSACVGSSRDNSRYLVAEPTTQPLELCISVATCVENSGVYCGQKGPPRTWKS